jgi:hypothetical protein
MGGHTGCTEHTKRNRGLWWFGFAVGEPSKAVAATIPPQRNWSNINEPLVRRARRHSVGGRGQHLESNVVKEIIFGNMLCSAFAFTVGWLVMCAVLSEVSRWPVLARRFPGGSRPSGTVLGSQVIAVGIVRERHVTLLAPTSEGLHLRAIWLFRFWRPPVFLPWAEVELVSSRRSRWVRFHKFSLGAGIATIRVKEEAFRAFIPFLTPVPAHS